MLLLNETHRDAHPMTTADGRFSQKTLDFLARMDAKFAHMSPQAIADRVVELAATQDEWRETKCLNMLAAENVLSRNARKLLDSDMATRLTEGFPGDKEFPPPKHQPYIDEIEGIIITLVKRMFRAKHVDWRPINTTMGNAVAYFALTDPGDTILVQSMEGGANMNYHPVAIPRIRELNVVDMPPTREFEIDPDAVRAVARKVKPKMLIVGGSYTLFPYPVRELRSIADEVGATVFYDAAHVALLIAAGLFQDPLREGADVMALSTHKIMSGPVGGMLLSNDDEIARKMLSLTFPSFLQTRDENKYAAEAYALAEMTAFGHEYARQIVSNAKALARALESEGFTVLGRTRGFTESHQVFLDLRNIGGLRFESACQACNILVHKAHMLGDAERGERTGARITVQELTRQGMKEKEMQQVARWMRRAVIDGEKAEKIAGEIEEFLTGFRRICFSFDV
jgi:glycine hydroxymethyltransferase